ncbi:MULTISPECIES: tyrosine-type recombinase/integrase [unclassified Clostridium]|uniref:tyrosine-type recombinase/integrase n=1 Tax=unclassified Clostridium TaxID=2614128 RepID=UPI0025B83705|nr:MULTISPECIES: site-specific integrase [unclassified Clostridium]
MLELINKYIKTIENENTKKNYRSDLEYYHRYLLKEYGGSSLDILKKLKPSDVDIYKIHLTQKGYGAASVNRMIYAVGWLYKKLMGDDILTKDITENYKKKVVNNKFDVYLTEEEVQKLMTYIENLKHIKQKEKTFEFIKLRDLLFFRIAFSTALRFSEICNIEINDVTIDNYIKIYGTKNGKDHIVPINEKVMETWEKYLKERAKINPNHDYLFITTKGDHFKRNDLMNKKMKEYCTACGIEKDGEITIHKTRHTAAHVMAKNNVSLVKIQEMLNHNTIRTTMRYVHVGKEDLKEVQEKCLNF